MSKCVICKKNEGKYIHYNGGKVCEKCLGTCFTCPHCGLLFDMNDFVNGDSGNGLCSKCSKELDQ